MSRCEGCRSLTTRPPMLTSPEVIASNPAMVLSNVDLPQPEGPTSTRKPPFSNEMSMPLRISTAPKRLRKLLISSVAISSSFHGAGHQAAHEITSGDYIDEQRRRRGDDRRRHIDVIFGDAGGSVDDIVERHRQRARRSGRERRAKQEVVPDVGELID